VIKWQQATAIVCGVSDCHFSRSNLLVSSENVSFRGMRAVFERLLVPSIFMVIGSCGNAAAGDLSILPVKAISSPPSYDWTGFFMGAHGAYATGYSKWSATEAGTASPMLAGSLDFFRAYDGFKGTGSYLLGLQAGYNYMFASRWVLGAESDVSFPSLLGGTQVLSSALIGQASYGEQVQYSGTVRGRIGYAPGHWLFYVTGGFAWTADQFTRTQIAGVPVGGTANAGDVESKFVVPRVGATGGAGVELALRSGWTARLEYLYTEYASRSVYFPGGAQRFDSSLAVQSVRLGLNYGIGRDAINPEIFTKGPSALDLGWFELHGQTTYVQQYAPPFRSPYVGPNSLYPNQGRETWDSTFFAGFRLWKGAELWINPEIDQGFGLSSTLGAAGFPAGTAFKIGSSVPYSRIPRTFIRQTIDLGGDTQKVEADQNQFAGTQTANRLVITAGKFSVSDVFDTNKYAQNPRKDFMNWALIDGGAFDYAADAWGFTYGGAIEWYQGQWTLRGGLFDLSVVPNSTDLDPHFQQFQWIGEVERRWDLWGRPGRVAITGFLSRGRMGRFEDAIQLAQVTGGPADISVVRRYTSRGGLAANLEQQVSDDLGVFARASVADGNIEPYDYTDIDNSVAAGFALTGKRWGQPDHTFGFAGIVNGISGVHQAFLNAGGLGILVGDGVLPNPGHEKIIETYYSFPLFAWRMTLDYQLIINPAYNADRGPVSVIGTRLRAQF
jgi:high affinity Mn2+ porin